MQSGPIQFPQIRQQLGRICSVLICLVVLTTALPALAQDAEIEAAPDVAAVNEEIDAPTSSEDTAEQAPKQNWLAFFFGAMGLFYSVLFFAISFTLVAFIIMNYLATRREVVLPSDLIEQFEAHLNEKRYQEAYELAKGNDSFLGQVLSAGLAKISSGYAPAIEAMQQVGEEENMRLEHRLSYIGLIGAISPMVGLLGTVDGMIRSFIVIAAATTAPKPAELASGISTALVTTLVALWIAIPAIAVYSILRNRVQRLTLEVGVISEQLMSRFQGIASKKG